MRNPQSDSAHSAKTLIADRATLFMMGSEGCETDARFSAAHVTVESDRGARVPARDIVPARQATASR
jgi:hypothetical protein